MVIRIRLRFSLGTRFNSRICCILDAFKCGTRIERVFTYLSLETRIEYMPNSTYIINRKKTAHPCIFRKKGKVLVSFMNYLYPSEQKVRRMSDMTSGEKSAILFKTELKYVNSMCLKFLHFHSQL